GGTPGPRGRGARRSGRAGGVPARRGRLPRGGGRGRAPVPAGRARGGRAGGDGGRPPGGREPGGRARRGDRARGDGPPGPARRPDGARHRARPPGARPGPARAPRGRRPGARAGALHHRAHGGGDAGLLRGPCMRMSGRRLAELIRRFAGVRDLVLGERARCDVVVVSDYAKGVIGPHLLAALAAAHARAPFTWVVDPKRANFAHYRRASLMKPNRAEAAEAAGIEIRDRPSLCAVGARLLERWETEAV